MTNLLNRAAVRRFALDYAKLTRSHKFERVSEGFLIRCQIELRNFVVDRINRHPSKGKTLQ